MPAKVTIGIQARSTSRRFPRKIHEMLGSKTILDHVVSSASEAAQYLNFSSHRNGCKVDVALCIPSGQSLTVSYGEIQNIIFGPEHDVLKRYSILSETLDPDYIVRLTADCPLIPSFIISTCITKALINKYDYLSNVDERCRTTPDGWDCEVISKRLLKYADDNAKDPSDREHVTTFIRKNPPDWIKQGTIVNFLDLSDLKISLDTPDDLQNIKSIFQKREDKLNEAISIYGKKNVHRV